MRELTPAALPGITYMTLENRFQMWGQECCKVLTEIPKLVSLFLHCTKFIQPLVENTLETDLQINRLSTTNSDDDVE